MKRLIIILTISLISLALFSQSSGGIGKPNKVTIGENTVYINSIHDMPDTNAIGEYLLDSMTNYILNTTLTVYSPIRLQNGTTLRGAASSFSQIIYLGDSAMMRATDASFTIRAMQLIAPSGGTASAVFRFENADQTKIMSILDCFILNSDSIGGIHGFNQVNIVNDIFRSNKHELVLDSIYALNMSTCYFKTRSGTTSKLLYFPDASIYESVNIVGCVFDAENATDTMLYFGNVNIDFGMLTSCSFKENYGVNVYGLNANTHPEFKFYANNNQENYNIISSYTNDEIAAIPAPIRGMLIGNETDTTMMVYTGIDWRVISLGVYYQNYFTEDFSDGDFTTNGWVTVQDGTNDWYVGTADPYSDTYSAYVSDDSGTSNTYDIDVTQISHVYIDILLPAVAEDIQVSFKWKCEAEPGWDRARVYYMPTSVTPVAGSTAAIAAYQIGDDLDNNSDWQTFGASIGNDEVGTTMRICITWINDGLYGENPPINFDDFKINYN